jgi:hypothetical protein
MKVNEMKTTTILAAGLALAACTTMATAGEISGELARTPWSGSFWPLKRAWAAFGNWGQGLAPFEKYDNYVRATRGKNPGCAAREADPANGHNEAPDARAENWTGHCHGWAPAALMEPEPPVAVTIKFDQPVHFQKLAAADAASAPRGLSGRGGKAYGGRRGGPEDALELATADTKAMLTEIYTEVRSSFHGSRYNARNPDHDSAAYMDLKPHVMHQLLVKYVKDSELGIVFDVDPGYMVWNQPIYKFESQWAENGNQLNVQTTVHWANDNGVDPDFHGLESVSRTYTYVMIRDASGAIVDSQWTDRSVDDHPDFAWQPYAVLDEQNMPGLDLDVVREMIAANGTTVKVVEPGAPGDEVAGDAETGGGDAPRDENRRNLWDRMRDGLRRLFGRG